MPTYDYLCGECGHKFEVFQSMKDAPKKKCPKCRKMKLSRLFGTGAGIIFKGSGFYQTDYRSDSYRKAAESEKKSAAPAQSDKPAAASSDQSKKQTPAKTKTTDSQKTA